MYDPERGWSLSFGGCGFLGFYYIGATRCLSERAPHILRDARMFFGCSAGALHSVVFLSGIPLDRTLQILMDLVRKARSRNLGVLHPSFNMGKCLRDDLQEHLPDNVHQLISGRISISLTRVSDGKNVLVSDFQSKDEVVDALLCSCFIPFYCGLIPPAFRGVRYVDGGASDNIPLADAKTTITVSPFYGECDICPKIKSTNFLHVNVTNLSFRLCLENVYLLSRALFPPDTKVGGICLRGYLDACRFLEESGIRPRPSWCSWAPGRVHRRLEVRLGEVAASSLREDASLCSFSALTEAMKDRSGYLSKFCSLLPVRVMSYVMLPCTLPVESAIALVQRLVIWLPDIPNDIQWLQGATSQVCACMTTRLLPTSR
uniref:Acylglycerol transacylase n=1 Tax=Sciurus vulgaris TaxID=55149 RepID=A0A8D2AYU6_SCIVU